jgi:hypothetical protein
MAAKKSFWKADLEELLSICERRSGRAKQLPHCAICARYSGTSPAFEGILSLLETLPTSQRPLALAMAAERLARVPASQRSQQVTAVNFGPLLDSPGWPLVGGLIIDMGNEDTARHLSHPALAGIEELTLLGFAYGNAVAGSSFTAAVLDSNLSSVRVLTLHSTDLADEDRTAFWSSPFAARLERIEGITYRGEALPHTLQAQEIHLCGTWDAVESFEYLLRLFEPGTTPHLQKLHLGSYYAEGAATTMLQLLEDHRREVERIPELEIAVYGRHEMTQKKLRTIRWPESMRKISWSWHSSHGSILGLDGDTHHVYRPGQGESVAGHEAISDYPGLAIELEDVGDLSRSLRELKVIAPPTATLEELHTAVRRFEHLTRLCIVYPFTEVQLPEFLAAVSHITQVEIYLTLKTGCFTTQYRQVREEAYRSDVSPRFLLKTLLQARHLSIYSDVMDVSRTPTSLEHVTMKTDDAVLVLAASDPGEPIEVLTIEAKLSAAGAEALANSTLLGRVYRLNIEEGFSDEAAAILAACPRLRGIRILRLSGHNKISDEGFATLIRSPHLAGVLDLSLGNTPEGGDIALAEAPMLPRLVDLDLHNDRESEVLPASGRLRSLRRISEWLSMSVFEDGRLAKKWLTAGTALPLHSRLQQFVGWVYRVPDAPLTELIPLLESCKSEDEVKERLRDVVARAFDGTPVPDGRPFVDLTPEQQATLRAIIKLDTYYWCVSGLLSPIFESYGLPRFERVHLERYIVGKDIWGRDEAQPGGDAT